MSVIMDVAERHRQLPLVAALGVLLGAATTVDAKLSIGAVGALLLAVFAVAAPVANLAVILGLTTIVPFDIQNRVGIGGGSESAGLLLSDVLLLVGLTAALPVLARQLLERRHFVFALGLAALVFVAVIQTAHGIRAGHPVSEAGAELRAFLGYGAFFIAIALPLRGTAHQRLVRGLLVLGILLGLWGALQWFANIPFTESGDAGVREGVSHTTGGKGQLQGGLFGYPVAIVLAFSALLVGEVRSNGVRALLLVVILLNGFACLVTFERTLWLATAAGIAFVTLKAGLVGQAKMLLAMPIALGVSIVLLSTVAPEELSTARERFLSLRRYETDTSLRYRVDESRAVMRQIREKPVAGSGFGASVYFSRPYDLVPPQSYTYTHNAYLRLAWRVGLPSAIFLIGLLGAAVILRARPPNGPVRALTVGAQAGIFVLLMVGVTFPSLTSNGTTPVIGLLLALAVGGPRGAAET